MKSFIVAFCLVACAYAAEPSDVTAEILRSSYENTPEGGFQYNYETSNGIASQVEGHVKPLDKDEVALEISGSNQYTAPDGEKIEITYIANENGYQPQGAHLPTPPPPEPIPEYVLKAIAYNAAHAVQEAKP